MSDLTDQAIAAAARAFTDAHNNAVDRDYEYGIPFVSDNDQTAAIAGIRAAAPIIEAAARADERAKIAEEIARAIDAECRAWADGSPWGDGMDQAAAIARQHAAAAESHAKEAQTS